MKKLEISKTIQLVIFIVLAAICMRFLIFDQETAAFLNSHAATKTLTVLIWIVLAVAFLCIFADYLLHAKLRKSFFQLEKKLHRDELSRLENRAGCDILISQYSGKVLPDDAACIMLQMDNIREINEASGRAAGDMAIQDFSTLILVASAGGSSVGRNGGNKFLVLFEEDGKKGSELFLKRLDEKLKEYNISYNKQEIKYSYGKAFPEETEDREIHSMIALSDKKIPKQVIMEEGPAAEVNVKETE